MHGLVNVKLMRRIDGLVGNLLCTALAAGKELSRPFAAPPGPRLAQAVPPCRTSPASKPPAVQTSARCQGDNDNAASTSPPR